jgi:hypothetical protein
MSGPPARHSPLLIGTGAFVLLWTVARACVQSALFQPWTQTAPPRAPLFLMACYNIACLRLTYFNEWKYDADTKNVYGLLTYYSHTYGVTKASTNWRYVGSLNSIA